MNQSFFTLSLGIAAMEILGSYMSRKKHSPLRSRPYQYAGHLCSDNVRTDNHYTCSVYYLIQRKRPDEYNEKTAPMRYLTAYFGAVFSHISRNARFPTVAE